MELIFSAMETDYTVNDFTANDPLMCCEEVGQGALGGGPCNAGPT